jgi:CTP synthase
MNNRLLEQVKKQKTKFIVVTGGVCSTIGKGVLVSSLGTLLKNASYSVSVLKCDPYLNVDPGTMSPLVHGEVFVTDDGAETDLDLGHYERIVRVRLTRHSSVSSGQIFQEVIDGERKGTYLGRCIQLVPHVVNAIKKRLLNLALETKAQFLLIEIGGTVGDMEGETFLESVRQLKMELSGLMMHCHLSFLPMLSWTGELKTKPTQHSVMLLKRAGLIPDALFLRTDKRVGIKTVEKLSIMCGVPQSFIYEVVTFDPLYKLFLDLKDQLVHENIQEWFGIRKPKNTNLSQWNNLISLITKKKQSVKIGLVVKYIGTDPYISVVEAIKAAGYACNRDVELVIIFAQNLEKKAKLGGKKAWEKLASVDGIVVPGGFDERGLEGKIVAATYASKKNIPYFGLCLGMQVMLIEAARSLAGLKGATSTEIDKKTKTPLICLLEEQKGMEHKGASMRLGAYPCTLKRGTKARAAYRTDVVNERHRHRYEFNNKYRKALEKAGVVFSGIYKEKNLIEIAELKDHPFMLATQFHPEFLSSPLEPHSLFEAFMQAVIAQKRKAK